MWTSCPNTRKTSKDWRLIIIEAVKLWLTYPKFFMLLQLSCMLPVLILSRVTEYVFFWITLEVNRPPPEILRFPHLPSYFTISFQGADSGLQLGHDVGIALLISAAVAIVFEAAGSLASSAILYAVGLHYDGQSISFLAVLRVSVPGLWMQTTLVNISYVLLWHFMIFVQTVVSFLLFQNHPALRWTFCILMVLVGTIYLEIIFTVAATVSVLEKDYVWAAVGRSLKLRRGNVVPTVLQLLCVMAPIGLGMDTTFQFIDNIPSGAYYILGATICWYMKVSCAGLQYMSLKAFHNEDLAESLHGKQTMKGELGRDRGESCDAKVGGCQVDTLV